MQDLLRKVLYGHSRGVKRVNAAAGKTNLVNGPLHAGVVKMSLH